MGLVDWVWRQVSEPDSAVVPSRAYIRAVIAIGHAMVGATAAGLFGLFGLIGWGALVPVIYWLTKERGDLRRGGTILDGLEDTVMVTLGLWYGAPWWPALILGCAAYVLVVATVRGQGN